jgi:TonB family protein
MTDRGLSIIAAVLINGLALASMAFAQMGDASRSHSPAVRVEAIAVAPVELQKRGVEPPDVILPRIKAPALPPPPKAKTISLSLEIDRDRIKQEARALADTRRESKAQDAQRARRRAADRKRAMTAAIGALKPDLRADPADQTGMKAGDLRGTSTNPATRDNEANDLNRIIFALQAQFEVPTVIAPELRKRMRAKVAFAFDETGKLTAPPRIVESSGNRLFDQAAERALRRFSASGPARLPVPSATRKRSFVLWMSGEE